MSSAALAVTPKSPDAFRTISEVSEVLDVPQHVLRFWEGRFTQIKPVKRAGGRRFYRPEDVDLLRGIRTLLYGDGLTIRGVQKVLKERGLRHVTGIGRGQQPEPVISVVEKIVFVDRPVLTPVETPASDEVKTQAQKAHDQKIGSAKKRGGHLRAVPAPMSLPFFQEAPAPLPVSTGFAAEERARLEELLDELSGLKTRLRDARS